MLGFEILNFGSLKTSIANPPGNSAKSMSNLVRFRHRGVKEGLPYAYLEQADGYALKYALPATTQAGNKITNCIITDIKSFYVKEHGGQNVQVAVGTYTKTARYDATIHLNRSGIWMRPYWDPIGVAWVDSWFELTEMEIFKANSTGGYGTSTIECTTTDGFAANYFQNWTLVFPSYGAANQADNYFLITASADSPTQITYFGANASITRTLANAQMYFVRNFINQEMPASLIGMIIGLFNEIRLTTGNTAVDTLVMGGFRTKTFGWATPDASMDRLIGDRGFLDCWANAFYHTNLTQVPSTKPLLAGKYYLQDTLLMDDGQETALRDPTQQSNPNTFSEATAFGLLPGVSVLSIVTDGTYIYVLTSDNLVTKYDSDLKKSGTPLLLNSANPVSTGTSIMLIYNGILYVAEFANIESINASTMTSIGVGQIVYNTNFITSLATDGTYLYCGSNKNAAANNYINRVLLSALTVTGPFAPPATTLDVTAIGNITSALYVTNTELYAGIDSKAAYISLAAFTVTGNYALDGPVNQFSSTGNNNRYLLAAINLAPGKLDYLDTVLHSATTAITFSAGQNYPIGIVYDGAYQWVAFNTNPILFMKLSADGTTVQYTFTAPAGQTGSAGLILLGPSPIAITTTAQAYIIILNISGFAYQVTTGTTALQFQEMISAGAIPKRAAAIRHYLSTNGVDFYLIKEVSLLSGVGAVSWGASAVYDASTKHFYHQSGLITIDSDDQNAIGALAQVILGRDPYDQGAYPFLVGAVAGKETFIGNVLIDGVPILNSGIVCAVGSEAIMNDVFPNDAASIIDLEYSDGDQIRAILALGERALYLKRRNTVLVSYNEQTQGYDRDIADRGHGGVSQRACNVYGETAFYMDGYGARSFNTGSGGQGIGDDWILDWQALTQAQKEASCSIVDIINRQWVLNIPGIFKQYTMDLDTGEWVSGILTDTPTQFADNAPTSTNPGTIDFLDPLVGNIHNIGKATLHNSANFNMQYMTNRIEPLLGNAGYSFDILPEWLAIKYNSSVPIGVNIYLNDSVSPLNPTPYILAAANTEALIGLPISARAKGICLEFVATTSAAGQTVQIKYARFSYDTIAQGGDQVSFSS